MATLTFYNDVPLNVKNNYIIDDITSFLDSYEGAYIANFAFIDNSKIDNTIIVQLIDNEVTYEPKYVTAANYLKIVSGFSVYYYFIMKKSFASKNAVRLDIRLDTLNTFNGYYTLSNRTLILREHKDRFYEIPFRANYINREVDYYARKIDKVSEGISPALYNITSNYVVPKNIWYLIYRNKKPPVNEEGTEELINPVECALIPKTSITINGNTTKTFTIGSFFRSYWYYCLFIEGSINSIRIGPNTYSLTDEYRNGEFIDNVRMLAFYITSDNKIKYKLYFNKDASIVSSEFNTNGTEITFDGHWDNINRVLIESSLVNNYETMLKRKETHKDPAFDINTYYTLTSKTITDVDRSDSRLIKIIELPYSPLEITPDNLQLDILSFYVGEFILKDLNASFKNTIASKDILHPISVNAPQEQSIKDSIANFELGITEAFESKLYHSDFYFTKYFYDSFSMSLQYELFDAADIEDYSSTTFTIDFIPTTTINSRFLFKFNFEDGFWLYQNQDFNQIINVARSNELTIYNNAYINYLRAGYNYDVKSKQRNITSSWVGVGLSAIGTIASFASSVYTGGVGIAGGIGLATSTAGQIYNAVNNQIQSEQNLSAKLHQLELQSASVYGADDVDLLNAYGGQELKVSTYQVSKPIKDLLLKLFYLTGYTSNRYGVPVMNTRKIFDYCQANIVFENTTNLTEEMQIDIAQRFADGVYTFHKIRNTNDATSDYDLSFEHENLENWLYDLWR